MAITNENRVKTHDIAIEVDNESYNSQRNESLKGLANTLTLFLYLSQRPLKIWAALPCLSSVLENSCEQNGSVSPPNLQVIDGASPRT